MGKRACYGEMFVRTNLESSSEESIEIKLKITHGNVRTLNLTEFLLIRSSSVLENIFFLALTINMVSITFAKNAYSYDFFGVSSITTGDDLFSDLLLVLLDKCI